MSNGFSVLSLSGSVGGAPILLDDATSPGKLIHANPVDSGGNDIVQNILVGNPNSNQITLIVQTIGTGAPTKPIRIDVPPTAEGTDVRIFYTPFILEPGFSYYVSAQLQAGNEVPYLYGYVERHAVSQFYGYGGLITTAEGAIPDILTGNWATVPFQSTRPGVPVNVTTDPGNNRMSLNVPGVWAVSAYVSLAFNKLTNADRVLRLRFWNETDNVEASDSPFPLYVEEGTTGGSWSIPTVPIDATQDLVGKFIRVEIGGANQDFTGLMLAKAGFNSYLIDPQF